MKSKADNKELEEAIKTLKRLVEFYNSEEYDCYDALSYRGIEAIETLLKELKRLQEENKTMETEIAERVYWESTPSAEIKNLYIAKYKIREKIEELNKNRDMISGCYAIAILEELLNK